LKSERTDKKSAYFFKSERTKLKGNIM